jgi:uncharacterized YccA/Bax inhibitor family protein
MRLSNTSNPVLTDKAFSQSYTGKSMTVQGTVNKSIILFLLLLIASSFSWKLTAANPEQGLSYIMPALLIGFGIALVTIFKKEWAPITAPLYVLAQGVLLGAVSVFYASLYEGIVMQTILLTLGIMFFMLFAYKTKLIVPTQKFKSGVIMATGGVALVYIASIILNLFGIQMPFLHDSGPVGILISLVIIVIASLNLILDFSFIDESASKGAPKYMEWFAAFGLMVTLIWLYLEILRLLSKLRN